MKVLMVNPNRYTPYVAPLGLEYVCNSLLREGIEFEVIDLNFSPESLIYDKLRTKKFNVVGITVRNIDAAVNVANKFFIPQYKQIVQKIKNICDCHVVLGGSGFSLMPQEIVKFTKADFGIYGYGEEALPQLIRELEGNKDFSKVDNLIWWEGSQLIKNSYSQKNYPNLPPRKRDIIRNYDYYRTALVAGIEPKRGCPYDCGYCCEPQIVGSHVVTRDIDNILEEILELKSLGIELIIFNDSEFNLGSKDYLHDLCEQMIKRSINVNWLAHFISEKNLPVSLLQLMKKAGCKEIVLTATSGSDKILETMNKKHTVEDTILLSKNIKDAGIYLVNDYLFGLPGESLQTIDQTISLIERINAHLDIVYVGPRIYPNTKLQQIAIDEGQIDGQTNLLYPVFYNDKQNIKEFLPYLRKRIGKRNNVLLSSKLLMFENMVLHFTILHNFQKRGIHNSYSNLISYFEQLSWMDKSKILAQAALRFFIPFLNQYMPTGKENI